MQRFASIGIGVAASAVAVSLTMPLPVHGLLHLAHRLPGWLEPRAAVAIAQAFVLTLLFVALRLSPRRLSPGGVTNSGVRAVAWLVLATFLFSLLVSLTLLQGDVNRGTGDRVPYLVSKWVADFPVTGTPGRLLLIAVLVPMLEEFLFRGLILGWLMRSAPAWLALAVSTVLFALGHDSWLISSVMGLGYGLIYLRYRSLWLCVLAHGAHNGLSTAGASLLAAYLSDHGVNIAFGYWTLPFQLAWLAAAIACAAVFLRHVFGRIEGEAVLRMRQPVVPFGGATTRTSTP